MKKILLSMFLLGTLLSANAQVPNYVPADSLKGWWPFNGNANDESGNGNNGTVSGATLTSDRFGLINKAYSFDGINDFIEILYRASLNNSSGTVSVWIKSNGAQINSQKLIYGQGQGRPTICVNSNNNHKARLQWVQPIGWAMVTSTSDVDNSQWIHIVGVYDTQNLYIYINSVLESTYLANSSQWNCSQYNYHIGAFNGTSTSCGGSLGISQAFKGIIDDIGAWNRKLSQQEINNLYNGNICYQTISVTDTLIINVKRTSYNPLAYINTIKVYPNPTKDKITIDNGDITKMTGYSIKIYNSIGQQLFQSNINQQQYSLDITQWGGNGLYFMELKDNNGNIIDIKKIVLQ